MSKRLKKILWTLLLTVVFIVAATSSLILLQYVSDSNYMQTLEAIGEGSDSEWISFWFAVSTTAVSFAMLMRIAVKHFKREQV